MDDSLGERLWVDRSDCKAFVENIQTAFGTKLPHISMVASETAAKAESAGISNITFMTAVYVCSSLSCK